MLGPMVMTKTSVAVPKPRTPAPVPEQSPVEYRLVLKEELAHAGADPDELDDDWLLAKPTLFDRILGRA